MSNIGFSFFFLTLGTILLGRGVPMGTVALVNLLGAVYFARFLAAPVVDRYGLTRFGHYRGWVMITQVALIGTLAAMSAVDPSADLPALLGLMGLVLALTVLHDTGLNGLVVRLLPSADRGVASGIATASAGASMLAGSSGALLLYARAGWTVTVLALAAVFTIPLAVLARFTEPPVQPAEDGRAPGRELIDFFRRPHLAAWAVIVIPVFAISEWLATSPRTAMLLSAGWPMDRIALVQSLTTAAGALAALIAGVAVTRYGRPSTALAMGLLGIVAVAALFPAAAGSADPVPTTAALMAVNAVYSAKLTWISTVSMDLARPSSAATDYSVPMSVEGVFVTLVNSAGLALAAQAGFPWLIGIAVVLGLVGTAVGPAWSRRRADRAAT
ncbi:MFS transporter [Actinomadura sp. 9N215]|uniref:MFS transporter n=1 Tax=Actinomadura sp. 9N215 TaxID=3375150 RepID=UPI0037AD13E4